MSQTQPAYEESVFINCPFDADYRDLMLAIVFSVTAHGFSARSARETEGLSEPRITRILQTLAGSQYSIHDLSRYSGEGPENLARFNMPLELGMAVALRFERERMGTDRPHHWCVLVPVGYSHQRFISDLAGFDHGQHEQTTSSVIREVCGWLDTKRDPARSAPMALEIHKAFGAFQERVGQRRQAALGKEAWTDLLLAARETVPNT